MSCRFCVDEISAVGVYYSNRVKNGGDWRYETRPESEWGRVTCEPIVPETLFNEVVQIMEEQKKVNCFVGKVLAQAFSNPAWRKYGGKMYVRSDSAKYFCRKCSNKIPVVDLEGGFHEELEVLFTAPYKIASHIAN